SPGRNPVPRFPKAMTVPHTQLEKRESMQPNKTPRFTNTARMAFLVVIISQVTCRALADYYNNIDDSRDQQFPLPAAGAAGSVPTWSVSQPYLNLWVADRPVYYRGSEGADIGLLIAYKQRNSR